MSKDLNEIINRIHREERLKTEVVVTKLPVHRYRCDQDKYSVEYNEATEMASYYMDGQDGHLETPIPLKQRNYYVDTGYWKAQ